jgi:UDP:flavonoid glycosyltransferase YjiC (YdhE family)
VATLPQLDRVRSADAEVVRQVGPIVSWGPRVPAEPTVLVSLSTFGYAGMTERLQQVVDACADLPARIIVTTGPHIDPASLRAPQQVELHRFVPHDELLPSTSVLVGHGGHGTTMTALAHDVPVVVLPLDPKSDHEMVGRSLERTGAGRLLRRRPSAGEVDAAVRTFLVDGEHRRAAARLGSLVRAAPGAVGAADALEGALPRQRRVSRE